ncbi:hypothetical protein JTE90_006866 [Oedothorax gibbosus]|uniref:Tantalus-like domain-containing protein n=1 Tax=Oedothorax gibbosus TaxID=931172 RepID=A0AAV6UJY6_9ARAC|nr:hypothetical protein JTE90_006866 [Oedothorax gibbosus]
MSEIKKRTNKKLTVEELYQNKNFVPPKEKNLETIFEEPRKAKNGTDILTSVRKYRRYLHFDPTQGKIQKRKLKAKKCVCKMKTGKLKTRSTTKKKECDDISLYILQAIGDLSDSEMEQVDGDTKDNCTISAMNDSIVKDTAKQTTNLNVDSEPLETANDKSQNSEDCGKESLIESSSDAVPEETEPNDSASSSCIVS